MGLAARRAQALDGPEAALEILADIQASLRRIEMLAAGRDDGAMLAAALRATEAAQAAEELTARQVAVTQVACDSYARGRMDMAAEVADRRRLRRVC